jgi:defect-in-organelle-trafficking protein DotC
MYQKLRAQNIVSAPFVATTNLGVTGGGAKLNVNDQVLRIMALPALQPNSSRWRPILNKEPQ